MHSSFFIDVAFMLYLAIDIEREAIIREEHSPQVGISSLIICYMLYTCASVDFPDKAG